DAITSDLVTMDPADVGTVYTVGPLGVNVFSALAGFDIITDGNTTTAFAAVRSSSSSEQLYTIDLTAGHATAVGTVATSLGLAGRGTSIPSPPPVAPPPSTPGVFDPSTGTWYLRNEAGPGSPDAGQFPYGAPGWVPVVGDWVGPNRDTVGVVDPGT